MMARARSRLRCWMAMSRARLARSVGMADLAESGELGVYLMSVVTLFGPDVDDDEQEEEEDDDVLLCLLCCIGIGFVANNLNISGKCSACRISH